MMDESWEEHEDPRPEKPCASVWCREAARRTCAGCDAHLCRDCVMFSREADEWFCSADAGTPCGEELARELVRAGVRGG